MLPKHSRLSKQTIEKHLLRAKRARTAHFLVIFNTVPREEAGISVVASKKITPKATLRNLLRRRVYSAVKPLFLKLKSNYAILITHTSKEDVLPKEITEELNSLFEKERLYS